MNKQYFYIGKEEALKHQTMVYAVSQKKITDYKEILGDNALEFYGDNLPHYLTVEGESVREAKEIELFKAGIYKLQEGEFISGENIYSVNDFKIPDGMIKPVFNYNELIWEESATQTEHEKYLFEKKVIFYNQELEFASKANIEFACGIITENVFEEVKTYMKSIEPISAIETISEIKRPEIFKKYLQNYFTS